MGIECGWTFSNSFGQHEGIWQTNFKNKSLSSIPSNLYVSSYGNDQKGIKIEDAKDHRALLASDG